MMGVTNMLGSLTFLLRVLPFIIQPSTPCVKLRIYDITMSLSRFCGILGICMTGTARKIKDRPTDSLEFYQEVSNDDTRIAQREKIRNIQLPVIRYFAYYLATSILGTENTNNISHYHLAFLA